MSNETEGNKIKEILNPADKGKAHRKFKIRFSPPAYFAAVAAIFFIAGFLVSGNMQTTGYAVSHGSALTGDQAAEKALDYINEYLLQPGFTASLVEANELDYVYLIKINISGPQGNRDFKSYVTKDGKILFISGIDITSSPEQQNPPEETRPPEVPKTDKPEVHAFVMSYCPFGLQFMKAYIPVIELLGDKADLELNFVHYAMHGKKEVDENTRIYCIQKEQRDKLTAYLRCFVEKNTPEACMDEAGIDKETIESCISSTDEEFNITGLYNDKSTWSGGRYPPYPVDSELSAKYGVRGSPTFVINGKTLRVTRSPEAIKQAVCNAFTNPPEECEQTLSTKTESPGIGKMGSGDGSSGSGGQC